MDVVKDKKLIVGPLMKNDKFCDHCETWLDKSCFHKNKAKSDGFNNKCKDCIIDYKKNPTVKIKKDFYYIPDIYLVGYGRTQFYQHCCIKCENPFFCLKTDRDIADLFCESCDEKDFFVPEKYISPVNYIGNVVGWITKIETTILKRSKRNYKNVFKRDGFECKYCGFSLSKSFDFTALSIDHIRPVSAGGNNSMENLVVSCLPCNAMAGNKWFSNFEEKKEYILWERQMKNRKPTLSEEK